MFNARSEGLTTSPVFRRLLKERRCAVPLDGFYEWTTEEMPKVSGDSKKQPWYVHNATGEPLWVAGLHDCSTDGELETFTMITRDVDARLSWLHDRQPVVLDAVGLAAWLSLTPEDAPPPLSVLTSSRLSADALAWYPVAKKMSKLDYQEPDCASPVKLPSQQQKSVASFFGKALAASSAEAVTGVGASSKDRASSSVGACTWECPACTYRHEAGEANFLVCAMCGGARPTVRSPAASSTGGHNA